MIICQNCSKEISESSIYGHVRTCYSLHLQTCETCKVKLYWENEIHHHKQHKRTQYLSIEQQKERVKDIINEIKPKKKRKIEIEMDQECIKQKLIELE